MATFTADWTASSTLHTAATLTNGSTQNDDINMDTLGAYAVRVRVEFAIASGSPAGDVVINIYSSTDNANWDTEPVMKMAINFTATGTKSKSFTLSGAPGFRVSVTNNTTVSGTYGSTKSELKQVSA